MKRAVGAVLATLALSACTPGGGDGGPPSSPAASTTTGAASASGSPPASSPAPTSSAVDAIAAGSLENAQCIHGGGGSWLFTGTLRNGTQDRQTFTVAVALTSNSGALVVGHANSSEVLAPGESREVSLPLSVDAATSVDCSFVVSQEVAP
ncbi:hypothetical protein [Sinomonas mesophila]|uniref:hypothetical protein n=1 Tax=Sinomonas mesophila TaxID=1531955 RepID=UPI00111563B7|nr:hypothetical protein [Sinomonas mesophila]